MWPMLLDLSRDEAKRILRRLELEAYASLVSAFRAQGDLTKDKKTMLSSLQSMLSISTERHRAEVRRAVNDEKLATIADNMTGSFDSWEWQIEGRRLVPIMPRLVPQTAFTATANKAATAQAERNATLPSPSLTGNREHAASVVSSPPPMSQLSPSVVAHASRPSSPTSNVVVLPSGMAIHIKGGLNTGDDDNYHSRRRRRSSSAEGVVMPANPIIPVPPAAMATAATNTSYIGSPVHVHGSKSPFSFTRTPSSVTGGHSSQKVIFVSSSGQSSTSSIMQKSLATQIVRAPVATTTTTTTSSIPGSRTSILIPGSSQSQPMNSNNSNLGNVFTMAMPPTPGSLSSPPMPNIPNTSVFLTPTLTVTRPRLRASVPRQKFIGTQFQASNLQGRPGVVIPLNQAQQQQQQQQQQIINPSTQTVQSIQIRPAAKLHIHSAQQDDVNLRTVIGKPTIQIKQDGGMKIITQALANSSSKILPKPQTAPLSGTPLVMVSQSASQSSAASSLSMVTKALNAVPGSAIGTRIVNLGPTAKVIKAGRANVVHINPKTLNLAALKNVTTSSGAKPNVIVVQKGQARKLGIASAASIMGTDLGSKPLSGSTQFEKELVNFIQKQEPRKHIITTSKSGEKKVIVTQASPGDITTLRQLNIQPAAVQRSKSEPETRNSSLLADLIQAAGIFPDSPTQSDMSITSGSSNDVPVILSTPLQQKVGQPQVSTNEWFEYDTSVQAASTSSGGGGSMASVSSTLTDDAISALLEMQGGAGMIAGAASNISNNNTGGIVITEPIKIPGGERTTLELSQLSQLTEQLPQQQFYTIEQAMKLISRADQQASEKQSVHVSLLPQQLEQSQSTISSPADQIRNQITPALQSNLPKVEVVPMEKSIDLLSSSLTEAQIDLDPYQFINEDLETFVGTDATVPSSNTQTLVRTSLTSCSNNSHVNNSVSQLTSTSKVPSSVLPGQISITKVDGSQVITVSNLGQIRLTTHPSGVLTASSAAVQAKSGIGSMNLVSDAGISTSSLQQSNQVSSTIQEPLPLEILDDSSPDSGGSSQDADSQVLLPETTIDEHPHVLAIPQNTMEPVQVQRVETITVPSLPMSEVESSAYSREGFRLDSLPKGDYSNIIGSVDDMMSLPGTSGIGSAESQDVTSSQSSSEQIGDSYDSSDTGMSSSMRASKRRRKAPMMFDDDQAAEPSSPITQGWVRPALNLLYKVSRYRGLNPAKRDYDAASWFLYPVDPDDAPDYYEIVTKPMDFSMIRKKLEADHYSSFEDFHYDMLLVRDNCIEYNPEGHKARRDCEEVFLYYLHEYSKAVEKWNRAKVSSPTSKKPKLDRSPEKSSSFP